MTTEKYDINKPWLSLDDWQKDYIKEEGNCFVCCGRQSGKSAAVGIKFGDRAVKKSNQVILVIAFTEKQAYSLFFKILTYLTAVYPKMICTDAKKKPTKHEINLKNGSKIMCHAAGETGIGLRGYTCTSVVVDECAGMAREIFTAVTPMISVTKGTIDVISTPLGKEGYFYECSLREDFKKFWVSAEDCPRHSKEFLESEKKTMTQLDYAREYLAQFLDEFRRVFPDEWIKKVCTARADNEIYREFRYYSGWDLARMGGDKIAGEVLKKINNKRIIHTRRVVTQNLLTNETEMLIIRESEPYGSCLKQVAIDAGAGTLGVSIFDHLILKDSPIKHKVIAINNRDRILDRDGESTGRILKEDMYHRLLVWGQWGYVELLDDEEVKASLASCLLEESKDGKLRITGKNTHEVEGIVRALWAATEDKGLNLFAF